MQSFLSQHKYNNPLPLTKELYGYTLTHSLREHPSVQGLRETTMSHALAVMQGAPDESQFLGLLLKILNAKKVIEVGVFTGYTTLVMALSLPSDGKVIALDIADDFASIGKPFWKEAGVESKIDLRLQPASKSLDELIQNGESGTFDLIFIDADKTGYDDYYEKGLVLLRTGGVAAIDNVLWHGHITDENSTDADTVALRRINEKIAKDSRVDISLLTIGDGLTLAVKK